MTLELKAIEVVPLSDVALPLGAPPTRARQGHTRQWGEMLWLATISGLGMTFASIPISRSNGLQIACSPQAVVDISELKRRCASCGLICALFNFHKNRSKPRGVDTQCKSCVMKRKREQRLGFTASTAIEARVTLVPSPDFQAEVDGLLGLICEEVINECRKEAH